MILNKTTFVELSCKGNPFFVIHKKISFLNLFPINKTLSYIPYACSFDSNLRCTLQKNRFYNCKNGF